MDVAVALRLMGTAEFLAGFGAGLVGLLLIGALRRGPDWGLVWLGSSVCGLILSGRLTKVVEVGRYTTRASAVLAVAVLVLAAIGLARSRLTPTIVIAFCVSVGGIWATVPDTEEITVLLSVSSVLVWSAWPLGRVRIRAIGAALLPMLPVAAGLAGSAGRPTAMIGMLGSMASLVLLRLPTPHRSSWLDLLFHLAFVLVWSRIAGLAGSLAESIATGAVSTAALLAVKIASRGWLDRHSGERMDPT